MIKKYIHKILWEKIIKESKINKSNILTIDYIKQLLINYNTKLPQISTLYPDIMPMVDLINRSNHCDNFLELVTQPTPVYINGIYNTIDYDVDLAQLILLILQKQGHLDMTHDCINMYTKYINGYINKLL